MVEKPKKIDIDGETIVVKWNQKIGKTSEGFQKAGEAYRNIIRVGTGLLRRSKKQVLLHELLHQWWKRAGLSGVVSGRTEENVIESLTPWIWRTLKDNPELVKYLFEEED